MDGNLTVFFFFTFANTVAICISSLGLTEGLEVFQFFAQLIRKLNSPLYWDTHGRLRRQLIPSLVAWFLISG